MNQTLPYILPYTQKFSPGENFRQFRQCLSLTNFFSTKFLFSENFTSRNFTRVREGVLTVISYSFWCPLLARCHYYLIFKLHLGGTCSILQDRYQSCCLPPSRRPTLLSMAPHSELRKARSEGPISS